MRHPAARDGAAAPSKHRALRKSRLALVRIYPVEITGDTAPTQATIDACNGCDILIHEVNTLTAVAARPPTFQAFAARYHTSTEQLAELAAKAKPGLLVLYHASIVVRPGVRPNFPANSSVEELLNEMQSRYGGKVVVARDLDIY